MGRLLLSTILFFSFSINAGPCSDRLLEGIESSLDSVAYSRPERTDQTRQTLERLESEIHNRVAAVCPDHETCSSEELQEAVVKVLHEVLDENPEPVSRWKGRLLFASTLFFYIGANVWISMNSNATTAATVSALMTAVGILVLTDSGAALLEPLSAYLRRYSYAADRHHQTLRGPEQTRQARIYRQTQEVVTSVEEEGRWTDRQAINQINLAELACVPHAGESLEQFRERAAYIFAKVLSDIVPQYPELDFSEPAYSTWSRVLFSKWYLDEKSTEPFRMRVLHLIGELFDPRSQLEASRADRYERVIRSWTLPLAPVTLPPETF